MPGGADDLNIRTVIQTALDAKGFEDYQNRLRQAGTDSEKAGSGAEAAGGHFDRLGKRLPNSAFHLLSYEMLANSGIHGHIRPLIGLTTVAMESMAGATGVMSNALVGATLGLSILIPLVLAMRKGSDENAASAKDWAAEGETLLTKLESLREKTGGLTKENQELYNALLELRKLKREEELDGIRKKIEELTATYQKETDLTRTLTLVRHNFNRMMQGNEAAAQKEMETRHSMILQLDALTHQEALLAKETEHGTKTIDDQIKAADEAKKKAQELEEQKKRQASAESELANLEAKNLVDTAKGDQQVNLARVAQFETSLAQRVKKMHDEGIQEITIRRTVAALWQAFDNQTEKNFEKNLEEGKTAADKAFNEFIKARNAGLEKNRQEAESVIQIHTDVVMQEANMDVRAARTRAGRMATQKRLFDLETDHILDGLHQRGAAQEDIDRAKETRAREWSATSEELNAAERERVIQLGQLTIGAIEGAFGQNKATAIATSLINTYQAASKAYAEGGPYAGPILAAMITALGMVQVNKIRQQKREAGFDDPLNDRLMREMGRNFAIDAVRLAKEGFYQNVARMSKGAMAGTVNQSTTINRGVSVENLNMGGYIGSPRQALLQFERARIRIGRLQTRTRRR